MLTLFFLAAHLQQRCWSLAEHSKLLVESIKPGGRVSTTQFHFISAHKSKTYRLRTAAYFTPRLSQSARGSMYFVAHAPGRSWPFATFCYDAMTRRLSGQSRLSSCRQIYEFTP